MRLLRRSRRAACFTPLLGLIGRWRGRLALLRPSRNDVAAHDLGLLVLIAGKRDVPLDLGKVQIAAELLLHEMGKLEIAPHGEVHAVIGSEPLDLSCHVRTVGAEPAGLVGKAVPRIDELGAVDEGLLAVHLVHRLGVAGLAGAAHDGETDPIDGDVCRAELLDEGLDPLTVDLAPALAADLQPVLAAA